MRMAYFRFHPIAALLAAGCIISGADDDDNSSAETGGPGTSPTTSLSSDPSVDPSEGGTSGSTSGEASETGGLPMNCGDNLLEDPGFEGGSPSTAWTEVSQVFKTPLCDAECTEDEGAEPFAGDWWAWFGGVEQSDESSVSQTIAIPAGPAILQFRFFINTGAGTGDDIFYVSIDDEEVFMANDLDEAMYDSYTLVEVELDEFAAAGDHLVTFGASITGDGLTNFFLDNVVVVSCGEGGGSSSTTTGETMTDTDTATETDTTMTGTDTDTDTGSGTAGTMGTMG